MYLEPQPATNLRTTGTAAPSTAVKGPTIAVWLQFCDFHLDRKGEDFTSLIEKFEKEGFRNINQLASNRISIEKLSEWLGVGKGMADLIIVYADEDVKLLREGKFMDGEVGSSQA